MEYGRRDLTAEQAWDRLRSGKWRFVIGGNPHVDLPAYVLPFAELSSLRVTEALAIAAHIGAIPFTDSDVHSRLMRLKLTNARGVLQAHPEVRRAIEVDAPVALPKVDFGFTLIDRLVGDEALLQRSVEELLDYRRANSEAFDRLHGRLGELASSILDLDPGSGYEVRLTKILEGDALPEIRKAADELQATYDESFGRVATGVARSGVQAGGAALAASTIVGVDLGTALITGAVGAILAMGGSALRESVGGIVDNWRGQRRAERSNSFLYLTQLATS